jgi:very-short-patch-repair endonuclease
MSIEVKIQNLFEFISHVFAIDLPIDRDVTKYDELWWQADMIQSSNCKIKEFYAGNVALEPDEPEKLDEDTWLSVTKRSYKKPPDLPYILNDWVDLSSNPTRSPSPKPSIIRTVSFDEDTQRVAVFKEYEKSWNDWKKIKAGEIPSLPEILKEWIDKIKFSESLVILKERRFEERFEDDRNRLDAFNKYVEGPWKSWSEQVLPQFIANHLYDELFSLYQRLSVEGDRIEIIWGHLFLSWNHSSGNKIYYPLILTPMNLHFDPKRRNIYLTPSQTIPTKLNLDCLINLDYPNKEELTNYSIEVNKNKESPPEAWNHNLMRGIAATITGLLSKESTEKSNLYSEEPVSIPPINSYPTIHNAPLIFVRERTRRLWIDDAKKIADSIYLGSEIPPFIRSLVADPHTSELPNPEDYTDDHGIDEDEGEYLLPLEYNAQQEEIAKKLNKHFGVLVQGPPGTGKSHTIANIVSSLLAKGKRILVTSQTENALRVLRGFIPEGIRSLCVSQLGSDTEAKRQLNEAVDSIGKHLSEKNSQAVEQKIQQLKRELRSIREEQARLRNQIKDWTALDSSTININGEVITAHKAAKECSKNEQNHSWFPDKLSPETEPPLTEEELHELCSLLKEIPPEDRKESLKYLPDPKYLMTIEVFSKNLSELQSLKECSIETENLRSEWGSKLDQAQSDDIDKAINLLEKALLEFQEIRQPWQHKILQLMDSGITQDSFWRDFTRKCSSHRDSAWQAYQIIQNYEIKVDKLPSNIDIEAALEELERRKPTSWISRILLSEAAKLLYESITVDGRKLDTQERVNAAKKYFTYEKLLKNINTLWKQTIVAVDGPNLDLKNRMPLADIDEKIKTVRCLIDWKDKYYKNIKNMLMSLGCREQIICKQEAIEKCCKILHGQKAEIMKREVELKLSEYQNYLNKESLREDAHNLWKQFSEAVGSRSIDTYEQAFNELLRLQHIRKKAERLESLSNRLKNVAPIWYGMLEKKARESGIQALEKNWEIAWRWRRLNEWLNRLHNRESVESLQNRLERARRQEREIVVHLVKERTWQRQIANVKDYHYKALIAWSDAMRRYGKGTGKHAQRFLTEAAKAMIDAVSAVPAWIMPLHRVIQSFPAEPGIFDVVIVDEASQCDIRALLVLYRAKKVIVVGDPEQISPSFVGVDRDKVFELNRQFLSSIPHAGTTFLIENSLYDISKTIPRMDRTLLTEHFRCVPEIIEFNNHLCPSYGDRLEPLRQPNPHEKIEPSIHTIFVETGYKNNIDINKPEAEALVDMLVRCCNDKQYARGGKNNRKRTMGVISLLGENQAKYISELIAQRLDETERDERRIICGDAYAFQGDERDVMFLSLVIAPNAPFTALVRDADRQRFNVATSRARDQVFLFHSVRLGDVKNPECVRYKLLDWYLNPHVSEIEHGIKVLKQKAESDFEIEVGERIIKRGFKVIPQYRPFLSNFSYRIDLVVQGHDNRVAVECDGDRWHGIEKWEEDQRREAQLRRAGWKFWRINGSAFYRNKDKALDGLWRFLWDEGIKPVYLSDASEKIDDESLKEVYTIESKEEIKNHEEVKNITSEDNDIKKASARQQPSKKEQGKTSDIDKEITKVSNNWRVWFDISHWGKETGRIES